MFLEIAAVGITGVFLAGPVLVGSAMVIYKLAKKRVRAWVRRSRSEAAATSWVNKHPIKYNSRIRYKRGTP